MATRETTLYLRNGRPNRLIVRHEGIRHKLEFRGHREDTIALPIEAQNNPEIVRWMREGRLEKITAEAFNKLASRVVGQTRPDDTRRAAGEKRWTVPMTHEESSRPYQVKDGDFQTSPEIEYNGDLVSTEEEIAILEELGHFDKQKSAYPSKYREG